ncbi:hypothetical protein QFC21_007067 [Naganishia friedmannii]|uniref:Uncharacterized protein n=1 Tax=Naganishia friedmannii TaxID=89922 RepID=A0ACC2UXR3_9TREE|nr:hypothetical protein QFC21_007067 [Naganishia friedmannii]
MSTQVSPDLEFSFLMNDGDSSFSIAPSTPRMSETKGSPILHAAVIGTEARAEFFTKNFKLFWERMFTVGLEVLNVFTVTSLLRLMFARLRIRSGGEQLVWTLHQWILHERADPEQMESFNELLVLNDEQYSDEIRDLVQQAHDVYQSVRWMNSSLATTLQEWLVAKRCQAFKSWSDMSFDRSAALSGLRHPHP